MADSLAPKTGGGISFEQPVPQPSALQGVASLADLFVDTKVPKAPTAAEVKNTALTPFAREMRRVGGISDPTKRSNAARSLFVGFVAERPELTSEASEIMTSVTGIETRPTEVTPEDAVITEMGEYAQTPQGQMDYIRSVVMLDGEVDQEATGANFRKFYFEEQQRQEENINLERRLDMARNDRALLVTEASNVMDDKIVGWTTKSQGFVDGLVVAASNSDPRFDEPQEQLAFLRESRRNLLDMYRAEAQEIGVPLEVYRETIAEAVTPIDNIISTMEANQEDAGKILQGMRNTAQINLSKDFMGVMGNLGGHPEMQKALIEYGVQNNLLSKNTSDIFKYLSDPEAIEPYSILQLPSAGQQAARGETIVRQSSIADMRAKEEQDPGYAAGQINASVNLIATNPANTESILRDVGGITVAAEAQDGPLSHSELMKVFGGKAFTNILSAAGTKDVNGVNISATMSSFIAGQKRRNVALLQEQQAILPPGFSVTDGKLVFDYATLIRIANSGEGAAPIALRLFKDIERFQTRIDTDSVATLVQRNGYGPMGSGIKAVNQSLQNINMLDQVGAKFEDPSVSGGEGAGQVGGTQGDDVITGTPAGLQGLTQLIDRTEGGADYDTLFGFSQREGGQFAGIRPSQMTIGQLKEFSNVNGDYGQWVKGQVGRVATPMGRYQFVGTTLKATAEAMGLGDNVVFDQRTQDAMFAFKVRQRLSGASTDAAKRSALRAEWEGFKNVTDDQLNLAIKAFESGTSIDFGGITVATGQTAPDTSQVPPERPVSFAQLGAQQPTAAPTESLRPQSRGRQGNGDTVDSTVQNERGDKAPSASQKVSKELRDKAIQALIDSGFSKEEADALLPRDEKQEEVEGGTP